MKTGPRRRSGGWHTWPGVRSVGVTRIQPAIVLMVALTCVAHVARAERMTNDDVVALSLGGLSEQTILVAIREADPPAFDRSVRGLLQLREAGLSEAVIRAVILAGSADPSPPPQTKPTPSPAPSSSPASVSRAPTMAAKPIDGFPADAGIYTEVITAVGSDWRRMRRAAVMGQNMDMAGAMISGGLAKSKFKTVLRGKGAQLKLRSKRPRFFYRAMGDEHPGELCLQRLKRKGDRRQYVGMKMSSFTGSMQTCPGESFDMVIEEISASGFILIPAKDLKPGEYALAGPGGARIFDFAIEGKR